MDHQQKDETAVAYLATAMNTKLARARAKGRSGWDSPECTQQHLSNLLREHVEKGDPVDVANFCAFLAARGEGIAPRQCLAQIEEPAQPVCWIRFCSDGSTEGPIMHSQICEARKTSGAWTPLYAGAAPAAVAGPAAREVFLVATGETSDGAETYTRHDDAPPPLCDAECLYTAPAAPALKAPAAPATSAQVQALRRARRALHAIGKTYDDSELRTRALEADEEIDRMLAAAPQAPAARVGLPWRTGIPPWTDDRSVRVIAVTAQDDFGGVQVHDIRSSDFHTDGDGDGAEVARVCTHWAYRDDIWPRANAVAPAAPIPWDNFPAYLIDHCEGQTITEEGLQRALSAMLANPQYAGAAPAAPAVDAFTHAELLEIKRAVEEFADCNETDVDYDLLMRAAQAGYLECTQFHVLNQSALDLDTVAAAQAAAKGEHSNG